MLLQSCNKIDTENGKLISTTLCKEEFTTREQSCVEYSYNNETKTLSLKHINAAFNCCPKDLYVEVLKDENTITIEETERSQDCTCLCLYDLDIEVYSIDYGEYTIKFKEPYIADEYELNFRINLNDEMIGSYCLSRNIYPWTE